MRKFDACKLWVSAAFGLDILTTGVAFALGAVEANPIMAGWSYGQIAGAKGAVLFGILLLQRPSRSAWAVVVYGGITTTGVVVWNCWQFARWAAFTIL